jgi:DNA-binding response OmpR family regulator
VRIQPAVAGREWVMASVLVVHSYEAGERYASHLRSHGYAVHRVSTPEEAFDFAVEHPPAVIITDVVFRMSGFNGRTFIHAVRRVPACTSSWIVALAGPLNAEHRSELKEAGADVVLGPHEVQELPAHLKRTFSERRHVRRRGYATRPAPARRSSPAGLLT